MGSVSGLEQAAASLFRQLPPAGLASNGHHLLVKRVSPFKLGAT